MNEQELAALAKQHGVTPQALLEALSAVAKSGLTVEDQCGDLGFWLIKNGQFETTVPRRDADTAEKAFDLAHDSLQPWYYISGEANRGPFSVKPLTYHEWCDWVRS